MCQNRPYGLHYCIAVVLARAINLIHSGEPQNE